MIQVGVDEAGYGPMLGPLVIGAAAFRLPDGDGPSLRERAAGIWCRATRRPVAKKPRASSPVPVDDSKKIHGRHGVPGLARGVASAVAGAGLEPPGHLADLLTRFADRGPDAFAEDPWCEAPERAEIPRYRPPAGLRERLRLRGIEPVSLRVSPITPRELNDAFDTTDNKGHVLFLVSIALVVRMLAAHPGEDMHVTLDREGGRLDYEPYLADVFPWREIRRLASPPREARYAFVEGGREVTLRFVTEGDGEDLSVGLASMAAKLTRELFMERLNAWFIARDPSLKPTAGYFGDGRRFLADAARVIESEHVDLRRLVRQR